MTMFATLVVIIFSVNVFATECPSNCHCVDQGFKVTYCVDQDVKSKNRDIIYHLHGSGGDATNWRDPFFYTAQIRKVWKDKGFEKPTVVAISFDFSPVIADPKLKQIMRNKWILTDKDPRNPLTGLLPYMTSTLIPKIEGEVVGPFARRMVVGESMGASILYSWLLKLRSSTKPQ